MIKKLFFLPLLILIAITDSILPTGGQFIPKTGHAMERAGVRLLNPVDSMLITGQTTDSTGRFTLR